MRTVAAVVALVICVHAGLWTLLQRQQAVANIDAPLASISYSPYTRSQHPDYGDRPTAEQIRADLKILSPYTQAIRTYSSTGGGELVPAIAAEFGLKVTLGIWIDKNEDRNEREIQAAIALARRYSNINAIVVGNETTLRAEKSCAGHHRRDLDGVDRASGACVRSRLHRGAHPALLGRIHYNAGCRQDHRVLRQAAARASG
jgi:exo-beta-1,3-glucanase (GH17 family)